MQERGVIRRRDSRGRTTWPGRLNCDGVNIGFVKSARIKAEVISKTAVFDEKMSLAAPIGDAMEEVLDPGVTMVRPARAETGLWATAHELACVSKDIAVCPASVAGGRASDRATTL